LSQSVGLLFFSCQKTEVSFLVEQSYFSDQFRFFRRF
jgi:hypothetical protein